MRLNEAAQHSWDARVAFDDDAAIDDATASLRRRPLRHGLGFMLGFIGKADAAGRAGPRDPRRPRTVALSVTDSVALVPANGGSGHRDARRAARMPSRA